MSLTSLFSMAIYVLHYRPMSISSRSGALKQQCDTLPLYSVLELPIWDQTVAWFLVSVSREGSTSASFLWCIAQCQVSDTPKHDASPHITHPCCPHGRISKEDVVWAINHTMCTLMTMEAAQQTGERMWYTAHLGQRQPKSESCLTFGRTWLRVIVETYMLKN